MASSRATNIVRMDWLHNRTPTGKRSATKARKLAQYLAFGRGRSAEQFQREQRGQWLDETGRLRSHEEVLAWISRQAKEKQFTHQFILSVKDISLAPEAFNRAMAASSDLFSEWRLISHDDSHYPHAHALAFGHEAVRLKSEAFREWWLGVRQALEQERELARAQQYELQHEQLLKQAIELSQSSQQPEPEEPAQREKGLELAETAAGEIQTDISERHRGFGLEL
jgi:hypothetical protein